MKNAERKIRSRKVSIILMEYIVVLGCLLVAFLMIAGKNIKQTSSYAKPEEVSRYKVVEDEYLTRVRPLTEYATFKEIAENSLNKIITVYKDESKTEEVVDGIITSGMVVEAEEEGEVVIPTQNKTYEIRVIGDLTGNGDCNVTELTRIIRHIVGIERFSKRGEEISADFSGEDVINVVDITKCINYIVYGKMDPDEEQVREPKIEVKEIGEEEERDNNWYNGDVEVKIVEQGEGISKIQTAIESTREGSSRTRRETTEEREITLTEAGVYKISSQSYGENGTKSRVVEKEISIDKTTPELEISREDIDMTQCKIIIRARDNGGIRKYSIQREGEEERSKEGIDQKELNGYVTIRENGIYKVTIEDKAGNKVEREIEIRDLNTKYTVIFMNEDGSIISQREYDQGERTEVPQNPSKIEDNTYTYEFAGWKPEVEETVTENKEYTATYRATYKNYTIIFKDENGNVISSKNDYHYGDSVAVPENPSKPDDDTYTYRFVGWDKEVSTVVEGNVEYKAVYEQTRKEYTITFKDDNGTVLTQKTDYHYGDSVAVPQNPSKQEDNTYTYEFAGWNPQIQETVTENKEYTATYSATYKNYTVTFKDEDGTIITTKNDYHYGDTVAIPENPSKEEDATNTYEFAGWNQEVEGTVTGNKEYIATYRATYKNYTVTFKDGNGEVLTQKTDYHYGDTVAIPQNPSKQEDETYTYEFTGWNQEVEGTVTENKEYTATYRAIYKNYTVTFKDEDGSIISTKNDYHYGDTVTIPEAPTKAEDETYTYEFKGWTPEIVITEEEPELKVKENIEYTATYEAKYKEYIVTFKQDTGEILSNLGYHYGDTVEVPEDPHKLSTMEYAYTFTGWNRVEEGQETPVTKEEIQTTPVTKEVEYKATYEAERINYTLIFYNDDYNEETGEGTIIDTRTYNYGDIIEFPEAQKEETEEIRYVFDGWDNLGTEERTATEIEIKFKAKYREEYYVARLEPVVQRVETINEETGETTTDEQIVVEGKSYLTLKEAVEEAGRIERTIRMLKDTEESVLVEDDQNITINLNGKTIRGNKTYVIKNYGELKIENNSDNEGKILEISEEEIGYGIYNREGKVRVESGTIAAETSKENGETYAIYNQSESPLTITGGSVIAEAKGQNSIGAGIYNLAGREIEVTGGLVYGNAIGENTTTYGIYNQTEGKVEVEGGIIQARASLSSGVSYGIYNKVSEEVYFKGGQIIVQSDRNRAYGIYNEEGKVTLGEIEITVVEEQEMTEERKGTINVTASQGYGVYNDRGTIEEKTADITMVGTTTYGIYNNQEGIITTNKGTITSTSTNAYGIYNNNEATINGITINNRNSVNNVYGIYNSANKNINIQNTEIIGGEYGVYSTNGNITINDVNITSEHGITTANNSQTMIIEKANIEATNNGIKNNAGIVILKDVTINSDSYGVYTQGYANTEIGQKDGTIDIEKPYIYGTTYAVYADPNSTGSIKYYDGKLQGQNVIYGGISDIEENSEIKIETVENEGRAEEVAVLQLIEQRNIARIGEIEYATLAEAVAAVPENQETPKTIEIINDSSISTAVEIPENKNVVVDLKGHTLTTYARGGIINKGTLEITDTQGENNQPTEATIETIETLETIESKIGIGITNEGTLLLTGGRIKSNSDGINNINNGQVKLQGGTIEAKSNGINNNLSNDSVMRNTKTEITSGIIKAEKGINNNYGQVTVTGGEIEGTNYGIYNYEGRVSIEEGQVKAENYNGLFSTSGEVIIEGGEILCTSRSDYYSSSAVNVVNETTMTMTGGRVEGQVGIRNIDSDITIGEKNGTVVNDNPVIIGEKYGIEQDSKDRNIKYYDGKVLGKEEAIYGSVNDIENNNKVVINTEVIDEQEYKVTQLVEEESVESGIAQIGETTYRTVSSLKQAIKEIPINTENLVEIKILENIELTQTLEIGNNQKIQLDLNGKEIRGIASIINRGELEITDKTENAEGKIINTNRNCIINEGTLRVLKGIIEGKNYGINIYGYTEVTIGNKDEEVETNTPIIKGENIAINGSINMYDGQLKGVREGYSISNIRDTEEGYEAYNYYEENEYITTLRLEDPVARKGETDYYSIQTAINEVQEGETIELLKSIINLKNTIIIPENKTINMNLKGYTVNSNLDKTIINNGTLTIENGNGTIRNTKTSGITVENNGTFNLNNSTIEEMATLGTAVQNKGVLNITGGRIIGDTYAIENKENGKINMTGGTIESYSYGIYNESIEDIDITGGTILLNHKSYSNNLLYGIYNNTDAKINLTGGNIASNGYSSTTYESYVYGIYNEANGEVNIGEQGKIEIGTTKYNYGIYNKGNGNVTSEGTIRLNGQYLAYGIRNSGQGEVKVTKGNIEATSQEGTAYGIENGAFGGLEITGGTIQANTTEGTSYGIYNISTKTIKVKEGSIKATGEESYGIYSNTGDIEIGENDGTIRINTPAIEGDKEGIYVNAIDTKFRFYDGKITGKQATNTEAIVPENCNILKEYDEELQKEIMTIKGNGTHIITFYNEDKTQIIEQKLFNKNDIKIEEPIIPEKEGYIGYWTYYEIGDYDIEVQMYYVIKRTDGIHLQATDENGITWNYTYNNGEATDVNYNSGGLSSIVNIPPRLDGYPVISIKGKIEYINGGSNGIYIYNHSMFYRVGYSTQSESYINQVNIPNSVSKISNYSFYKCSQLRQINLQNNVTEIGSSAFSGCTRLTQIEIPNSMTSIGSSAFSGCTGLTEIEIPNSVTSIESSAFSGCTGLTEIEIPNSVTSIESSAFSECTGLTEIEIPNSVTSIESFAFSGCSNLTEVNMPNVTSIGSYAFRGCSSLVEVSMPKVMNVEYNAFYDCNNLEYIKIGYTLANVPISGSKINCIDVDAENTMYSSIEGILYNKEKTNLIRCPRAKEGEIIVPKSAISIDNSAFDYCSSLTSIDISNVTEIGSSAFSECSSLTSINIPSVTKIGNSAFKRCNGILNMEISTNVDYIGASAFENWGNTQNIFIEVETQPSGWNSSWNSGCTANINYGYKTEGKNITVSDENGLIWSYIYINGEATNVYYTGNIRYLEEVKVPSKLLNFSVVSLKRKNLWNSYENVFSSVKKVVLPINLTTIGIGVFSGCNKLIEIEIPSSVTSIGDSAFSGCSSITEVNMPNVTSIGDNAFRGCSSLIEIEMTNVINIGNGSFYECSSLTNVGMSKVEIIKEYAFAECNSLTDVNMPNVESIGDYTFRGCSSLIEINISKAININTNIFSGCNNLTNINVSEENTKYSSIDGVLYNKEHTKLVLWPLGQENIYIVPGTISIGENAFSDFTSLTELELPDSVTNIGNNAFYRCNNLREVNMPSVTSIGDNAFGGCSSITELDMPNVTHIGRAAFDSCSNLNSIVAPNLIDIAEGYYMYGANGVFSDCENLTSIDIPNVTSIGSYAFYNCNSLTNMNITKTTNIGDYAFYQCSSITSVDIPNVINIGNYAFSGCSSITEVNMPNVTSIGDYAFSGCGNLTNIDIPDSTTNIGEGAFNGCNKIESIVVAEENTIYDSRENSNAIIKTDTNELIIGCKESKIPNGITRIGESAFAGCNELTSIEISESVTSIGSSAFYGCSNLTEVNMPNVTNVGDSAFSRCSNLTEVDMPNVTNIGDSAFSYCTNLKNVTIPRLTEIQDSNNSSWDGYYSTLFMECSNLQSIYIPNVSKIGKGAFSKCSSLTTIEMSNVTNIGNSAFYNCSSLTEVNIPNVTSIENYAFSGCSGLTEVNMPNMTSIENSVFSGCSGLTEVNIPNVTSIANYAFSGCSSLTEIEMPNVTVINEYVFEQCSGLTSIEMPNVTSVGYHAFYQCDNVEYIKIGYTLENIPIGGSKINNIDADENNTMYSSQDGILYNKDKTTLIRCPRAREGIANIIENVIRIERQAFYHSNLTEVNMPNVKEIGEMAFLGCENLSKVKAENLITIENGVSGNNSGAFSRCSNLTEIEMPNITSIGVYAFSKCDNLTEVNMPNIISIGQSAFEECSSLITIEMSNATSIGLYAFSSCSSLSEVYILNVTNIGNSAFYNCSSLSEVDIPNVTSIENYAFSGCSGLTEVNIPNVTSIGNYAFYNCSSLSEILIPNKVNSMGKYVFKNWTNQQTINIEASKRPSGWDSYWNRDCNANIVWGYKDE